MKFSALLVGLLAFVLADTAAAAIFDVTIPPRPEDAYETAHYRLWLPEGVEQVRAIIVRQHGCGDGARQLGREHANDLQWQALAQRWNCALLGTQLWAPQEDCSTWTIPQDGSAHAFLTALQQLADKSGHAELTRVPWCLWGHSGGAMWVSNMTYRYPERIVAVFPRSGGLAPAGRTFTRSQPAEPNSNPAAFTVPVLFCYGDKEAVEGSRFQAGVQGAHKVFDYGRSQGRRGPWQCTPIPITKTATVGYWRSDISTRCCDSAYQRPVPLAWTPNHPLFCAIDFQSGWLGDLQTKEIMPATQAPADRPPQQLAWLPDEATARAWQEFCRTGSITDTTPPPAPTKVQRQKTDDAVVLTWQCLADVESGIGSFRIYRDGKLLGELKGNQVPRWNDDAAFTAWNYSDQPLDGDHPPPLRFEDRDAGRSASAAYAVSMVNRAGLESGKTPAIANSSK